MRLLLTCCMLISISSTASHASGLTYGNDEKFQFTVGFHKALIWAFRESDEEDTDESPFVDNSVSKFDLKEVAEETGTPVGISISVNMWDIMEPRLSMDWFSFKYDELEGSKVDRTDYTLDILLGWNTNHFAGRRLAGLTYKLYPYGFFGFGYSDYEETIRMAGFPDQKGNIVLSDVGNFNLGVGVRFGLSKLFNVGLEFGTKLRDFKTVNNPQPTGKASEGYLKFNFTAGYGI
jgi:hypothetical protein